MVNIKKKRRTCSGFILIECLIAVFLTSVVGVYLLDSGQEILQSRDQLLRRIETLRVLKAGVSRLEYAQTSYKIEANGATFEIISDDWQKLRAIRVVGDEVFSFQIKE
ncbi:MAG: hypothetical protein LBS33_05385 [Streptococcaceae bacterium]|nr:hypothetical protein [Streptococcaceae bacterium]